MPKAKKPIPPAAPDLTESELDKLPTIQHLADVQMIRLRDASDQHTSATYTAANPDHPKVTLVMLHAEQCWQIGQRFTPFNNAVEFVLAKGWKRSAE